jgi:hypothetical protein
MGEEQREVSREQGAVKRKRRKRAFNSRLWAF